jgi:hypothetical protein
MHDGQGTKASKSALESDQIQLDRLSADYAATVSARAKRTAELAMFTCNKYANLQIWDCGTASQ